MRGTTDQRHTRTEREYKLTKDIDVYDDICVVMTSLCQAATLVFKEINDLCDLRD